MKIGIDFDNTIALYDAVFRDAAVGRGLVPVGFSGGKTRVKELVFALPDGETEWMRLQGHVYGALMRRAEMMPGLDGFLARCRTEGAEVYIISHKTVHGHFDPDKVNLRVAAMAWMSGKGFFAAEGFGIPTGNVLFESERDSKVDRIRSVSCDCFIDDLEAVLRHPGFPDTTTAVLLGKKSPAHPSAPIHAFDSWPEIESFLFG